MPHDAIAVILWSLLGLSLVLTAIGFATRTSNVLLVAAGISFVFAVAAIFSIGFFVLAIAVIQLMTGLHFRKEPL